MLTLNMDVPEPWLVEPVKADYDLDNLRLEVLQTAAALSPYILFQLCRLKPCSCSRLNPPPARWDQRHGSG